MALALALKSSRRPVFTLGSGVGLNALGTHIPLVQQLRTSTSKINERPCDVKEEIVSNPVLPGFPTVHSVDVQWGEMDAFSHVNNVTYFRYFETSRLNYFENIGYKKYMESTEFGPILAETSCKYKHPLVYPDRITLGTKLRSMSNTEIVLETAVKSMKSGKIAATGVSRIVHYDYRKGKRATIPDEICDAIVKIEGKPLDELLHLHSRH
eukprot:CFRG4684T1